MLGTICARESHSLICKMAVSGLFRSLQSAGLSGYRRLEVSSGGASRRVAGLRWRHPGTHPYDCKEN